MIAQMRQIVLFWTYTCSRRQEEKADKFFLVLQFLMSYWKRGTPTRAEASMHRALGIAIGEELEYSVELHMLKRAHPMVPQYDD